MPDDLKKLAEAAPMSDVEKVARAIAAADGEDYMEDFQRYDARAKAALAAMGEREPVEALRILPFHKAPANLRALSPHGGDEDWIAIVPKTADFAYVPFLEDCDRWFGCCSISHHEHTDYPNCTICIGAHS